MKVTLEAARVNMKLTQQEAAEIMGVTQATLSSWERGITDPSIKQLLKLCEIYNCCTSDIRF